MKTFSRFHATFCALVLFACGSHTVRGSDHAGAPALAQDPGADIGDVFAFLDPNDHTQVVLIATFRPMLIPGTVSDLAVFDENIRYRFEIYNDHVNLASPFFTAGATAGQKAAYLARVRANRTIDLVFSKREVGLEPQSNPSNGNPIPTNLRRPKLQTATVILGGFAGARDRGIYPGVTVTPFGVGPTASPLQTYEIPDVVPDQAMRIYTGVVDDPYFFDLPGFTGFLNSIRSGSPSAVAFSRARDTFAGYNIQAIALRVPVNLLKGTNGDVIGVDFLALRHTTELVTPAGARGLGVFRTVDRMGNPDPDSVLVPFDLRNRYHTASAKSDVALFFSPAITETLTELGLSQGNASFNTLTKIFVQHGDLLQLDTSILNTGTNAQAGFPNGRRVTDDVVQAFLTLVNQGVALDDNVPANDRTIPTVFPFLPSPNQPLFSNSTDDGTRN